MKDPKKFYAKLKECNPDYIAYMKKLIAIDAKFHGDDKSEKKRISKLKKHTDPTSNIHGINIPHVSTREQMIEEINDNMSKTEQSIKNL